MTKFTIAISYEYQGKSLNPRATTAKTREEVVFDYEGDLKGLFSTIMLFDEEYNKASDEAAKRETQE